MAIWGSYDLNPEPRKNRWSMMPYPAYPIFIDECLAKTYQVTGRNKRQKHTGQVVFPSLEEVAGSLHWDCSIPTSELHQWLIQCQAIWGKGYRDTTFLYLADVSVDGTWAVHGFLQDVSPWWAVRMVACWWQIKLFGTDCLSWVLLCEDMNSAWCKSMSIKTGWILHKGIEKGV